ncbi:hypothetical protein [uncultured Duncaniella sp.]|uniref:hypothetical protein n=1 Tax=uncultured Duncaniella sp. TaxID=2768039 RepID=UPI0026393195|nr:hypothetical protein [uncultured Duncaniella sp.]
MLDVNKLMALSEATTGFGAGAICDEFPDMTLSECAARLPEFLMESQVDLTVMTQAHNNQLVEATVAAIQTGDQSGYASLVEGAFETIKNKITAIFAKIKKFVKSIIDKLGVQINKVRMTGKQMWERYKDSDMLNHSFDDLVVNGYKFDKKDPFASLDTYMANPRALIEKGVPDCPKPDKFAADAAAALAKGDNVDAAVSMHEGDLEKLKEISSEDRKANFAKELLNGIDISDGSSWMKDLKDELWGDKVDLTFGTDFTLDSVKTMLLGGDLDKIRASYNKLLTALNKDEKDLQAAADKFKKDNKNTEQGKDLPKLISLANEYFTQYLAIYQDCTGVISSISSTRVNYVTAQVNQGKSILAKMLTYKKKKDESTDVEGMDEFDVFM